MGRAVSMAGWWADGGVQVQHSGGWVGRAADAAVSMAVSTMMGEWGGL